jgi:hypothetical protein
MISGYFTDLFRALKSMDRVIKSGGSIALVLGNVRFAGVLIPVDQITVQIAEQVGWQCSEIWTARYRGNSPQQMKRFGKILSSENILLFHKPRLN